MAIVSDAAQSSGDVVRRLDELERALREVAAGRRMESATIGSGGIKVRGGEIVIQTPDGLTDLAVLSSDGISFNGQPLLFPGSLASFAGPVGQVPSGWLVCDGAAVSRTTYSALFAVIGVVWGAGNGSTTFNLPDLRDRVLVGAGSTYSLGATGGAATHTHAHSATHTHAHSATHTHAISATHTHTNPSTGTDGSHNHGGATGTGADRLVQSALDVLVGNSGHTHSISSGGSHGHTVGNTGSSSPGTSDSASPGTSDTASPGTSDSASTLPPYAAVIPIIRT